MKAVHEAFPAPHQKYLVARGNHLFTATPCYGMHKPWWVSMALNDSIPGYYEVDPSEMLGTDRYMPLSEVKL